MGLANLYALLVGIDRYTSPVPPLMGCVNDILNFKQYLEGRSSPGQLQIQTLLNEAATREAVIAGFRDFLGQAGAEDLALFYYAGHGAQEATPEAFWAWEPDRLNETLVCYDSRQPGHWDLADKELAKLIAEVSANHPQMVVILDCCHSGSGTRGELSADMAVRKCEIDRRSRPLESFLFTPQELSQWVSHRSPEENPSGWSLPQGKHIVLSACRDSELAKEYNHQGERRGAFSYFLLETLQQTNGNLTYRDLFKRTNALIRANITAQSPQLEATDLKDLDRLFLGGTLQEFPRYFTVSYHPDYQWVIDGGAVHGVQSPRAEETTYLALFPLDSTPEQCRDGKGMVGQAKIRQVFPQLSQIEFIGSPPPALDQTLKALVTQIPLPPKGVFCIGEPTGIELLQEAFTQNPSPYFAWVDTIEQADFKFLIKDQQLLITRPVDDRPLVAPLQGYTVRNAQQLLQQLEQIIRWTTILNLQPVATTHLRPGDVQLSIYHQDRECQDSHIRLLYQAGPQKSVSPTFKVKLKNHAKEPLYCALLDLTDRYAINANLLPGGGVWLQPGEEIYALNGEPIYAEVPKNLWEKGITEVKDILKLIVSTAEFDATLLEQDTLDLPVRDLPASASRQKGTLHRLAHRSHHRALRAKPEEETVFDDWLTSEVVITTVRPLTSQGMPPVGGRLSLGYGVSLLGHSHLKAQVRLTSVNQASRDLGHHILPPLLQGQEGVTSLQFTQSRGTDPGLNALELSQVEEIPEVTSTNPLMVEIDQPLSPQEQLLAIAYDGEFFLPLGVGLGKEDKTEIRLERLPAPISQGSRSLGGAIRIFFQKIVRENLSLPLVYPRLALAEVREDETVIYQADPATLQNRVSQAQRIVLYVHGIIGDTESLVKSVRRVQLTVGEKRQSLAEIYDLVLTFDYESLNTPIEENARLLKQQLAAIGLTANHGKTLQIVAHSMGGLISRWLIEQEGGDQIVQQLIMLGTPNGGSPWPSVEEWAIALVGLALNEFTQITWPIPIFGSLMQVLRRGAEKHHLIEVCLQQMHPHSDFLKALAQSPDPQIPYQIIAGNVSLIPAALASDQGHIRAEKLLEKLLHRVGSLPFLGSANDIAVTTQAIQAIPAGRRLPPQVQVVACDHLVYFSHPVGLQALAIALGPGLGLGSVPERETLPAPNVPEIPSSAVEESKSVWGQSRWLYGAIAGLLLIVAGGWWWQGQQEKPQLASPTSPSSLLRTP